MCGQENKKMSVQDIVELLTQECIELRGILKETSSAKEKEKLVLKHIQSHDKTEIHCSNFQKGLEWFNVSEGLSMENHLAGKIVILDFFTYCCINCMHILPDLDALEKQYSIEDGVVVIGVHSAKFSNEKNSEKILSAVQRYNIAHPVVNDAKLSMWRDIGITCWPSLVILGPRGQILFVLVGEGHREEIFLYTKVAINYFKSRKQISNHLLPLKPAKHLLPASKEILLFPGKIQSFMDAGEEKLAVSDSGNNRILILRPEGTVEHVVGGYSPGFRDGSFDQARFNAPQGVCIHNRGIFIADNENHAIRRIDLDRKIVETLAGTGVQGHDYVGGKLGKDQELSSPWDVVIYQHENQGKICDILLIAIAGTHQIWALFLDDTAWWKKQFKAGSCAAIVGSGREENRNNSYPHAAGLAQPSGLAVDPRKKVLYFADSESSSIRRINLIDGKTSAVAGGDRNPQDLHNFGDTDGSVYSAKLQHPLGVAWDDSEDILFIADTYNHKIKMINTSGLCSTYSGAEKSSGNHVFNEPSGLTVLKNSGYVVVADTNNHCIKKINKKDKSIEIIALKLPEDTEYSDDKKFIMSSCISTKDSTLKISFAAKLNSELEFAPDAPQKWLLINLPISWKPIQTTGAFNSPVVIEIPAGEGKQTIGIKFNLIVCNGDLCMPKKIDIAYEIDRNAAAPINVEESKTINLK